MVNSKLATLTGAEQWALAGHATFPAVHTSKVPACAWQEDATDDPAAVRSLFATRNVEGVGVALSDSFVVFDIDSADEQVWAEEVHTIFGGAVTLDMLEPSMVVTPSGGVHIWTRRSERSGTAWRNWVRKAGPHTDVRTVGGYVLVPPTPGYRNVGQTLIPHPFPTPPVPERLQPKAAPAVGTSATPARASAGLEGWAQEQVRQLAGMPPETGRNNVLNELAYTLGGLVAARRLPPSVRADLAAAAEHAQVPGREATIESGWQAGLARPLYGDGTPTMTAPAPTIVPADDTFTTYTVDQLHALPPVEWLIPGILPAGLTGLYGPGGSGKTFVALDWALSLAAGGWGDRKNVLYMAGEGVSGIRSRVAAWQQAHPQASPSGFRLAPQVPRLMHADEHDRLERHVRDSGVDLVVVDTFIRCLSGGDVSRPADQAYAIAGLDRLRQYGTSVLVLHHTGRQDRELGATTLRDHSEAMWSTDGQRLRCERMKETELSRDIPYQLRESGDSVAVHPTVVHVTWQEEPHE